MVHFSVQLFSNEFLALKMVKEENLLFKMIFVLSKMVGECLDNYSLEVEGKVLKMFHFLMFHFHLYL